MHGEAAGGAQATAEEVDEYHERHSDRRDRETPRRLLVLVQQLPRDPLILLGLQAQRERLRAAKAHMITQPGRNFDNGYLPGPQGISKAFDLVSRRHLNTDMPWWNLPETIRAAAFCLSTAGDDGGRALCLRVLCDCHNAFREFVRPDLHLMAYQTRDECGLPVAAIPATADADPGYHTGLSLLDAIDVIEKL